VTHMPIKFARRVDIGSACVDIRRSAKTDVLAVISYLLIIFKDTERNLEYL